MDGFSLCLNAFCLAAQGAMHISFSSRLTGKRHRVGHMAAYTALLCVLDWFAGQVSMPWPAAIGAEVLLLYGVNRLLLGNPPPAAGSTAILAAYISQLSFGMLNSIEAVLFPYVVGTALLYLLLSAATAAVFAVCAACYAMVLQSISLKEIGRPASACCLLFPVLFFFTAELYILQTSYTQPVYDVSAPVLLENVEKHAALLLLQALGLGALFCTLYACRQLCRSMQTEAEMRLLKQAAQAQKTYIAEAQLRYEQTKAFRHDIKNHLSVLDGLLRQGKPDEGRAWLQKLQTASAVLSPPCHTGNAVVDILLSEKLSRAEKIGISAETKLIFPKTCHMDDFDLCVIFANALDNAITACQAVEGEKSIHIQGEQQGGFYLLSFQNTCTESPLPPEGTGLSNIRSAAEKYHGAVLTEKADGLFSLHVLLNIS